MTDPQEFAPWLALLVDWKVDPDGGTRAAAARSLLRCMAAAVATGREVPPELRQWLAECLREAASTGNANAAFKLSPGQGRHADYRIHMHWAAQIHAVMKWRACRKYEAADEVAALPRRLDASNMVKHFDTTARTWTMAGPYLTDAQGNPTLELAEAAHLRRGAGAAVVFTSLPTDKYCYCVELPKDIGDAGP